MAGDFCFGAVVAWDGFVFEDGGQSDKLLVILGAKTGSQIIAALATTKAHGRPKKGGCVPDHDGGAFYYLQGGMKRSFKEDTWIELYRPQEIDAAQLLKVAMAKAARVIFNLDQSVAAGIRNCLKQSPDVTPYQLSILE